MEAPEQEAPAIASKFLASAIGCNTIGWWLGVLGLLGVLTRRLPGKLGLVGLSTGSERALRVALLASAGGGPGGGICWAGV